MEEAIANLLGNDKEAILQTLRTLDPERCLDAFVRDARVRPRPRRALRTARPTTIALGVVSRDAAGSALVRVGDTAALGTVVLRVGRPSAAAPRRGEVEVRVHLGPCGDPRVGVRRGAVVDRDHEHSPYRPLNVRALESRIRRTLRSADVVRLESLLLREGEAAWRAVVDVSVLDHAGNAEDASWLAAVAALRDARLPKTEFVTQGRETLVCTVDDDDDDDDDDRRIGLNCMPVPLTVGLFPLRDLVNDDDVGEAAPPNKKGEDEDGRKYRMLVDPTEEEEQVCAGSLTVVVALDDDDGWQKERLISVHKPGGCVAVTPEDVAACAHLCRQRAEELAPVLSWQRSRKETKRKNVNNNEDDKMEVDA